MHFDLPDISDAACLGELRCAEAAAIDDDAILEALRKPVWSTDISRADDRGTVFDTVHRGESVCLVVSDHTRKTAADRVLPVLLDGLCKNGCAEDQMSILFASGIHRKPTTTEVERILGREIADRFEGRIHFHDPDNDDELVSVGMTPRLHTVKLNKRAVDADRLILLGGVVYHYHAGFGGGRKSLVPGLASRGTIAHNHSLTLDPKDNRIRPNVTAGAMDGNTVADEMLAGARLCRPDFIINTVLLPDGGLAGVFAGDLECAHRAACEMAEKIYRCDIAPAADFVIASACGASNWIQSHKALYNSDRAVKQDDSPHPPRRIVLVAPCPEGLGDERFRHWVTRPEVNDIFMGLRKDPEILGQTALSTRMRGARAILVSEMPPTDAADIGMPVAADVGAAIETVIAGLREAGVEKPTYYVMPEARYTVPFVGN